MLSRMCRVSLLAAALFLGGSLTANAIHPPVKPRLVTQTYPVADLVVPVENCASTPPRKAVKTTEAELMKLLTTTIAPRSWSELGGAGTMEYFPLSMSLVINQTPDVHEMIQDALAALRRQMDVQVVLETRIISVTEPFFERIGIDFNLLNVTDDQDQPIDPKKLTHKKQRETVPLGILNDKQFATFLEAVEGDRRANVMHAPRMTLLNGQGATLNLGEPKASKESQIGLSMTLRPVVSADRRSVRLHFFCGETELRPFVTTFQARTVAIPAGHTIIFPACKQVVEARCEFGPPVLSRIPYVNRLFKNVGYSHECQSVLVAITPRILVTPEEHKHKGGAEESEAECGMKRDGASQLKKMVAELVKAYETACAEGRTEEAEKLARAALILDPTCFARSRR